MIVITEDSRVYSDYALLYDYIYKENNVFFAEWYGNAISRLKRCSSECTIILDFTFDNQFLLDNALSVMRSISTERSKKKKPAHFIPVLCSEYVELCAMSKFGILKDEVLRGILSFDLPYLDLYKQGYVPQPNKNFEHACKAIRKIVSREVKEFYDLALKNTHESTKAFLFSHGYFPYCEDKDLLSCSCEGSTYACLKRHFDLLERGAECNSYKLSKEYFEDKEEMLDYAMGMIKNGRE